jgi:hypothetical protein
MLLKGHYLLLINKKITADCFRNICISFNSFKEFKDYHIKNTTNHQFIVVNEKESILNGNYEIKKININLIPKSIIIEW